VWITVRRGRDGLVGDRLRTDRGGTAEPFQEVEGLYQNNELHKAAIERYGLQVAWVDVARLSGGAH
jgi:hypothetical protein